MQRHGIKTLVNIPGVGLNLQDHFYVHGSYHSTPDSSYNLELGGFRKYLEGARYLLTRKGYLALGSSQVGAFVKSRPEEAYADLQISFRPMTFTYHPGGQCEVDRQPGMGVSVYLLRPRATGTVTLRSSKPDDPAVFKPNFLSNDDDNRAMIAGVKMIRRIMSTAPIASRVIEEEIPGPMVETDEQILPMDGDDRQLRTPSGGHLQDGPRPPRCRGRAPARKRCRALAGGGCIDHAASHVG